MHYKTMQFRYTFQDETTNEFTVWRINSKGYTLVVDACIYMQYCPNLHQELTPICMFSKPFSSMYVLRMKFAAAWS